MNTAIAAAALFAASIAYGSERARITGDYVEARTAEVFAGGCIMNSEAETAGRQAVLAWRVTSGSLNGVPLAGLNVAAAVAGDRNLGMREMGGEQPSAVRAIIMIDDRANEAQRHALEKLARDLSDGLITDVARVLAASVTFTTTGHQIDVAADGVLRLTVNKHLQHDASCGAMQWFKPFSRQLIAPAMGMSETHAFTGNGLETKWSAPHKRSAFYGAFAY